MARILKLTESDLIKLVQRVIKEQEIERELGNEPVPQNYTGWRETEAKERERVETEAKYMRLIRNEDMITVDKLLEDLPDTLKFLSILDCEYADFSDVDICNHPSLIFVNLKGTPNNFVDQVDCEYTQVTKDMFDLMK